MFCIGAERFIAISHSKAVNIIERMCNHILTNLIDQHPVLKLLNLLPEGTNMNIVIDKFKLIDTNKFFPAFDNVLANMPFFLPRCHPSCRRAAAPHTFYTACPYSRTSHVQWR